MTQQTIYSELLIKRELKDNLQLKEEKNWKKSKVRMMDYQATETSF